MRPLSLLVPLFVVGCGSAEADLDLLCSEYTQAMAKTGPYADLPAQRLQMQLAARLDEGLKNREIREAFAVMAHAPPEQAYTLWQNAAREAGVPDWSCPAMQ